jgi:hypothetical protein
VRVRVRGLARTEELHLQDVAELVEDVLEVVRRRPAAEARDEERGERACARRAHALERNARAVYVEA